MKIAYTPIDCEIVEYTLEEKKYAERILSIRHPKARYIPSYQQHRWDGRIRFLKNKKFPSGLLPRLERRFKRHKMKVEIVERTDLNLKWRPPDKDFLTDMELRPNQLRLTEEGLLQKRGILKGATGSGKTEVIALLVKCIMLGKNTPAPNFLVLSPASLVDQTRRRLAWRMGMEVGVIQANQMQMAPVIVASISTLVARLDNPSIRKYLANVAVLIVDETHHLVADTFAQVAEACGAPYRFGFSATPLDKKTPHLNMNLEGLLGPVVGEITLQEQIEKGYASIPNVYMYTVGEGVSLDYLTEDERYVEGAILLKDKIKVIRRCVRKLVTAGRSTLIIVERLMHGEILEEVLRKEGIDARFHYATGKTKKEKVAMEDGFMKGVFPVMIATRIFGEGKDASIIRGMVMAAENVKASVVIQNIGRIVRLHQGIAEDVIVVDFANFSSDMLAERSEERIKTYKSEKGIVIHKLDEEFA